MSGESHLVWLATAFLAIGTLPFLFYRAIAEDRLLLTQLPGYRDYAARVRWRLLPGLWRGDGTHACPNELCLMGQKATSARIQTMSASTSIWQMRLARSSAQVIAGISHSIG
jgi:hypothetical protein